MSSRRSGSPGAPRVRAVCILMRLDAHLDALAFWHATAADWLTEQLNGPRRVGLPWQSLAAFLRIATHPRAFERPLPASVAWARVTDWLSGNLIPDAFLVALAVEHGLTVYSTDTDFARFDEVRWENPLR